MARKKSTKSTALVQVHERILPSGQVRFYLHYTQDGERTREPLKNIPIVSKSDKQAYKESRAIAEKTAAERMEEIRSSQLGFTNRHRNLLMSDWFERCAEVAEERQNPNASRHTWARIIQLTGKMVSEFAGESAKIVDVDVDFVRGFINYLRNGYIIGRRVQNSGQHLSLSTAQKRYLCFHFVMEQARKEGIIPSNPCELLEPKDKIRIPDSKRAFLTIEELKKLMETPTMSVYTKKVYLFMCFCGLRISDVKQLKWGDVEQTENGQWRIIKIQQKTQDMAYIPLSERAAEYLPERGEKSKSDYIFSDIPSEPVMNRMLKAWAKRAGIEKVLTLHTARHTFATTLMTLGTDIYTVSKLLGHKSLTPTQIYAKIIDKTKVDAVNKLNNI